MSCCCWGERADLPFLCSQPCDLSHWPILLCAGSNVWLHCNETPESSSFFLQANFLLFQWSKVPHRRPQNRWKWLHVIYGHVSSRTRWKRTTNFQWQREFYTLTPASVTKILVYFRLLHLCCRITLMHVKHQAGLRIWLCSASSPSKLGLLHAYFLIPALVQALNSQVWDEQTESWISQKANKQKNLHNNWLTSPPCFERKFFSTFKTSWMHRSGEKCRTAKGSVNNFSQD